MSVKKILLLGSASLAAVSMTAAMAGGYTHEPAPVAENGYYIEGHLGYSRQNYFDNENWAVNSGVDTNINNNARGGFAGGLDAGYKINRHFAVELGWFHLNDVNMLTAGAGSSYLTSWVLYLAGKYMVPLGWMNNTDWFFKLGVAYRNANLNSTAAASLLNPVSSTKSTFVRPMFATGLDYSFSDAWSGIVQYAYFMGARNSFPFVAANTGAMGTVAANVFTLGLAYKFTV